MSRYIIEIKPEYEDSFKGLMILGAKDSNLFVDTIAIENLEVLDSDYINENFGDLQDEAYKKGLHDGESKCRYCNEYQRGLDDAWEAARKIMLDEGIDMDTLCTIFRRGCSDSIIRDYSASEAIEKLKAYEEKQADKIKIGDEVVWTEEKDVVIVVSRIYTINNLRWCDGICKDGKVYQILTEHARKTGRRFDISKILEAMRT